MYEADEYPFGPPSPMCGPAWWRVPVSDTVTNARVKRYLCKSVVQVANSHIFTKVNFEPEDGLSKRGYEVSAPGFAKDRERSEQESRRRAVAHVRDIALCNQFEYMLTWTLSPDLVNRYDAKEVYARVRTFLSNATQRKDFRYVLIPELHADGAIHLHGLCNLGGVEIKRACNAHSGKPFSTGRGQPIFNMTDWKLGFSTCIPLDSDYEKAVNYICKYITKSNTKIFGKWYLSSRMLKKAPDITPLENVPFEAFRDEHKLENNEQYETAIVLAHSTIKIVSEEFPYAASDK